MVNLSLVKSKYLVKQLSYVEERENEREPRFLFSHHNPSMDLSHPLQEALGNPSMRKGVKGGRKEDVT